MGKRDGAGDSRFVILRSMEGLTKVCSKCSLVKPVLDFGRCKGTLDGLRKTCKSCKSKEGKEYYAAHVEVERQRSRDRTERDPGYRREYALAHLDQEARSKRSHNLRVRYGLSLEDYEKLLAVQHGGCAICGVLVSGGRSSLLHVDHDHKTKQVRGLLCSECNLRLGHVEDIEFQAKAKVYLGRCQSVDSLTSASL